MNDQLDGGDLGSPRRLVKPNGIDALRAADDWLNGEPAPEAFHGKVVLLNVFRFDSFSCRNVVADLRALLRLTAGELVVVGIHTPLTSYERERAALRQRLTMLRITWPVVVDNDSQLWNAYGIDRWPTQLLFDRRGTNRAIVVGDAQDPLVSDTVRTLLGEPPDPV